MVANLVYGCSLLVLSIINVAHGINLGLFAGDKKHLGGPLTIKKTSHRSPIFININTPTIPPLKVPKLSKTSLPKLELPKSSLCPSLPKLPKPPPLKKLNSPLSPLSSLLPKPLIPKPFLAPPLIPKLPLIPSLIPKLPLLPIIPKVPLIPLIPPILPPILPPLLPLSLILPSPLSPILPPLLRLKALKLRNSLLKAPQLKPLLLNSLASEIKPVVVPLDDDGNILAKLRQLRKEGHLTSFEFTKFKQLLMRKK